MSTSSPYTPPRVERWGWVRPHWRDPRIPFAALLTLYGVLGFTFFGFNRSPAQMKRVAAVGTLGVLLVGGGMGLSAPASRARPLSFRMERLEAAHTGLGSEMSDMLERVDPPPSNGGRAEPAKRAPAQGPPQLAGC